MRCARRQSFGFNPDGLMVCVCVGLCLRARRGRLHKPSAESECLHQAPSGVGSISIPAESPSEIASCRSRVHPDATGSIMSVKCIRAYRGY